MHLPQSTRGLTLIEVILAIALFSILASIAATSWTQLVSSSRHTEMVNSTHRMFAAARSHAVHHKTLTTICPLSASGQCFDDWSQPISIFPDSNNDKRPDNASIHRTFNLSSTNSILTSRTAGRGYFQFAADGMSHGTMGSLIACSVGGDRVRMSYLALNIGGRLRTLSDEDQDGIITLPWGTTVSCPLPW
jgi:type IV fimbrial biogenesis protein FimT